MAHSKDQHYKSISLQFGYNPTTDMINQDGKTQILTNQTNNTKLFTEHKKTINLKNIEI